VAGNHPVTGNQALAQAVITLRNADISDPTRDARILLAHAIGIDPGRLTLVLPDEVAPKVCAEFMQNVTNRSHHTPISHIIGGRWFYNHWFSVTADVLDPRPETEILVDQALKEPFETVLDLGLGSGCILLTLLSEMAVASGVGTDISRRALEIARTNAKALGVENRVDLVESNWFSAIRGEFDLIVSNPPYIAMDEMAGLSREVRDHEPALALTPGGDGLGAYRAITVDVMEHLKPEGRLIVEIGPTQAVVVKDMFDQAGLTEITVITDLDGRDRVVEGRKPPK